MEMKEQFVTKRFVSRAPPSLCLFLLLMGRPATAFVGHNTHQSIISITQLYSEKEKRSISDYMGGHHAGKFDFDSRISGVTALNYEKSIVFEDQQSSPRLAALPDTDTLPSWASRKVPFEATANTICFGEQVMIHNEELTWEPFYASIESAYGSTGHVGMFTVSPSSGNLAPRGGRNNFSDSCRFRVERIDGDSESMPSDAMYLVV